MTTRVSRRIGVRLLVPVVAVVALLSGCTADSGGLASQYEAGSGDGYISRDGRIVQIAASDREEPVAFAGALDSGDTIDSADLLGQVVIVNLWYAACPPCREEAPDLEAIHQQYADAGVTMVGVNVRDSAGTSLKFAVEHGVSYPSIVDFENNAVQLAFAGGAYAPTSVPTTLVLDAQGRVAARLSGLIESPSVVTTIVDALLAESA